MNSGVFQLPVYKGKLPSAFIELLQNDRDVHVSDRIEEFLVTKEFETYKNQQISVVVKIVDNQRAAHYMQPFEQYEPSKRLMRNEDKNQYFFRPTDGGKKIIDYLPEGIVTNIVEEEAKRNFQAQLDNL